MLPMRTLRLQLGELLAADATTLAPAADANTVALIKSNFAIGETLVAADLTLANFATSTPLPAGVGPQLVGLDPVTGDQIITIKEPAGGFRWEVTTTADLPQTIYGFALFNDDQTILLGVELLPVPITLNAVGQQVDLGSVKITVVQQPAS